MSVERLERQWLLHHQRYQQVIRKRRETWQDKWARHGRIRGRLVGRRTWNTHYVSRSLRPRRPPGHVARTSLWPRASLQVRVATVLREMSFRSTWTALWDGRDHASPSQYALSTPQTSRSASDTCPGSRPIPERATVLVLSSTSTTLLHLVSYIQILINNSIDKFRIKIQIIRKNLFPRNCCQFP